LLGVANDLFNQWEQRLVLFGFECQHLRVLASERLPAQPLRRHAQRRTWKIERQNLDVSLPEFAHASHAHLAESHAVPCSIALKHESSAPFVHLVEVATDA